MERVRSVRKRRSWLMMTSAERSACELGFEPFDGRQVEMVGRLVEQQDIGLGRQHAGERGAAGLAAREARRILVAGEAEMLEQIAGAVADRCRLRGRPRHRRASWRSP